MILISSLIIHFQLSQRYPTLPKALNNVKATISKALNNVKATISQALNNVKARLIKFKNNLSGDLETRFIVRKTSYCSTR